MRSAIHRLPRRPSGFIRASGAPAFPAQPRHCLARHQRTHWRALRLHVVQRGARILRFDQRARGRQLSSEAEETGDGTTSEGSEPAAWTAWRQGRPRTSRQAAPRASSGPPNWPCGREKSQPVRIDFPSFFRRQWPPNTLRALRACSPPDRMRLSAGTAGGGRKTLAHKIAPRAARRLRPPTKGRES